MPTQFDSNVAIVDGELVNAAYTMFKREPNDLTPQPALPTGWIHLAWIQMSDFFFFNLTPRFYGFIAANQQDPSSHVIAIRGTEGWLEWYDDFSVYRVPFTQAPGNGWVAHGFDRIYNTLKVRRAPKPGETPTPPHRNMRASQESVELEGSFADQIEDIMSDRPGVAATAEVSIAVTGHSLGAALGTLYVIEHARRTRRGNLRSRARTQNLQICTFASPRVGDAAFVAEFNGLGLTSWRIVNAQDLVPNIPPDFLGYVHVDALQLFDSHNLVPWSPYCWHVMSTYLALVDPATHKLETKCQLQHEHVRLLQAQVKQPASRT